MTCLLTMSPRGVSRAERAQRVRFPHGAYAQPTVSLDLRSYGAGKDPQVTLQEQTTIRTRIGAGLATAAEIAAIALLDRIARAGR